MYDGYLFAWFMLAFALGMALGAWERWWKRPAAPPEEN